MDMAPYQKNESIPKYNMFSYNYLIFSRTIQ